MAKITPKQLHILQHAIGLDEFGQDRNRHRGGSQRNRFVTGPIGDDFGDCLALTAAAIAVYSNMHFFEVTDAGRETVKRESPRPPSLTQGQRRYQAFLDADCGLSFIDWLKVNKHRLLKTEAMR